MSNFAFIPDSLLSLRDAAQKAEGHIHGDPRAACFHARFALEMVVKWLYRYDASLKQPYDSNLGALLHEPCFRNLLPQSLHAKIKLIHRLGNQAVHEHRAPRQYDALQVVKELWHFCYWLVRHYQPQTACEGIAWTNEAVPKPARSGDAVPRKELEALAKQLADERKAGEENQRKQDAQDAELQALRQELAAARSAIETKPDPHDYSEAETRDYLIDADLGRAGWKLDQKQDREYEVTGMPNNKGIGFADYVLWGADGKALAVVEAKRTSADPKKGKQQAKLYADCLEQMHGQRPIIFYTNGYLTWMWDDLNYPPRRVSGFYQQAELERLIRRREQAQALSSVSSKDEIAGRYYQKRAIKSVFAHFEQKQRKALLVMATGTGKTRCAIALVDALQRAGWAKRVLFLADRISLVNQAANAFKAFLPDSSPVNLVSEKDKEGRVYVSTYPTMMGLINECQADGSQRFGVGHFDLIIIDEAHRSVYQKYGEIFRYFDAQLVGLTATPRDQIDKNTYGLFDLEDGVPTDAYELDKAVSEGYLVPPRLRKLELGFVREGINYDKLSDEEKAAWEALDWGDDQPVPHEVANSAINKWLFNIDTVDKVLKHLMEHGNKVEAGDRLGKTIIFARNHKHAEFIEERFDHHYPHLKGHFARVIDNQATYPQSLIDDFSIPGKNPHIAISVDMLDTGIDVPEVLNLVFFKPVYSKTKFWQMIGRGTRLCPDLFGIGSDKEDFRIFDCCGNFDFFKENPEGINASATPALGQRLFAARVDLLGYIQEQKDGDEEAQLNTSLIDTLHGEVAAMNADNFMVRMELEAVERYQQRERWKKLTESDREALKSRIAGLPNEQEADQVEARLFDMKATRMQLALVTANTRQLETLRRQVMEMASKLEEKTTIPAVQAQLAYLCSMQQPEFWEGLNLAMLEDMRLRLRGLAQFIDKGSQKIIYTDFADDIRDISDEEVVYMPTMTGVQYAKKVASYLKEHQDHLVIQRLRCNQSLTLTDLHSMERILIELGDGEGEQLLYDLLEREDAPSLAHFIRSMVGMDRSTVQQAFSTFLTDRNLSPQQIRFVELIIDQLSHKGVMDASALYEPPFSGLHAGGPEELFAGKDAVIDGLFDALDAFKLADPQAGVG